MDVQGTIALSHQMALRRRLDVIANNIANMNTAGFKREDTLFGAQVERMMSGDPASRAVAFVLDRGGARDLSQGEFTQTGNSLDVAIVGDGYFAVETANGATAYTRNGHFQLLADGTLGLASGEAVLDVSGQPLRFDPDDTDLRIGEDGTISTATGIKGRLQIAGFDNEAAMTKLGNSLLDGTDARLLPPGEVKLRAGMIEASNVKPIVETAEMVELMRSYQTTQRLIETTNDIRRRAIERLGRVN